MMRRIKEAVRMKILVIEDEKLLADSIGELLRKKGFTVEVVYDGETGEQYAELGIYDLLILDVMMPGMDGFQVARKVRSLRLGTPILMLTARSELEDRIAGLNSGADYYLTKPFDIRELLACINALLRRQGPQVDQLSLGNTSLDLTGCSLESVLYYPDREIPVLALLEDGSAVLITGFDEHNIILMDPGTGQVSRMGRGDAASWFEENGNRFVSYVKIPEQ